MKKSTVRTIWEIHIEERDEELTVDVYGNGFLYRMVRMIVGTLMEVGTGDLQPEAIPHLLEEKKRIPAIKTAPARGLTLMKVYYEEEGLRNGV